MTKKIKRKLRKTGYTVNTKELCEMLEVSRQTLYTWERKGFFTPPRNMKGERVFTRKQAHEIIEAFSPAGKKEWHFKGF